MSFRLLILAIFRALVFLVLLGESTRLLAGGDPPARVDPLPTTIDATCRDRFLKEAVPACKQLRERLRGIELELMLFDRCPSDDVAPDPTMLATYGILKDGVTRRLDRIYLADARGALGFLQSIDVTNSGYSFSVGRRARTYSVRQCVPWSRGEPQPLAGWLDVAEQNLAMGSNIWWLPIEEILANADFEMTGAECNASTSGDEVVRIVYRFSGKESASESDLPPEAVYWAELLPARFWIVVRSGVTTSGTESLSRGPMQAQVTTRFQEWDGVPLPKEIRLEYFDLRRNVVVRVQEHRFGLPRGFNGTADEFFLPHYGFSDDPLPCEPGPPCWSGGR